MSRDLQHIDDIFRDAIEPHEENPSPEVWESLQAQLDKEDASFYKRRYIVTRRVAFTLLLLLLSFAIYETSMNRYGSKKLSRQNDIRKDKANKPVYKTTERSLSSEKTDKHQSSNQRQQSFSTDKVANSTQKLFNKKKRTGASVSLQKDDIETGNAPLNNNGLVFRKYKYELAVTSREKTNKKHQISEINKSNHNYVTKKYSLESMNPNAIGKGKQGNKITGNQNDLFFPIARLTLIQPFSIRVNNDPIIVEPRNIVSTANLTFSDSLNQVISNRVQQKKNQNNLSKPYWTVTTIASPEWTQYRLENDLQENTNNQQNEKSQIEQREKHETSFTAGILATYQFKKFWGLQTGLLYTNTSIAIDPQKIYAVKEASGVIAYKYNSSSGYAFVKPNFGLPPSVGDSISTASAQHNLQCLSLPIIIKYKIEKKKFSISPGLGISVNFLTGAKIQTEVVDTLNRESLSINKLEGAKLFYIGLMANVDIQYNFYQKWSLNLMPGFRYALTPITKNNVVKTYPYNFGVGVGITYKL